VIWQNNYIYAQSKIECVKLFVKHVKFVATAINGNLLIYVFRSWYTYIRTSINCLFVNLKCI